MVKTRPEGFRTPPAGTIKKLNWKLRGTSLVWAIVLCTAMSQLLFGYDLGVLGGLVSTSAFKEATNSPDNSLIGTIVAIYNVGAIIGSVGAALFGDKLSRRGTISFGCLVVVIGASIQSSAFGNAQLIVARIITGTGSGFISATVPTYVCEVSKAKMRGSMIALQLALAILGVVIAYWLDYGVVQHLEGQVVWRFPIAFQCVFAIACGTSIWTLPESPRWLYKKGRHTQAISVFAQLFDCELDAISVRESIAEIQEAILLEKSASQTNGGFEWNNILYDKSDLKITRRIELTFLVGFFQEITGSSMLVYFSSILFQDSLGFDAIKSQLLGGCLNVVYFAGALPAIWTFDKFGRRIVLISGSIVMTISMVLFTVGLGVNTTASGYLALVSINIWLFAYGSSWLVIPYLYSAEITPLHLRHIGGAVGVFSVWLWSFVTVEITPVAIANTGYKIFIFYCIVNLLTIPFVYYCMPETKGLTLEEIDCIFSSGTKRLELEARFEEAKRGRELAEDGRITKKDVLNAPSSAIEQVSSV